MDRNALNENSRVSRTPPGSKKKKIQNIAFCVLFTSLLGAGAILWKLGSQDVQRYRLDLKNGYSMTFNTPASWSFDPMWSKILTSPPRRKPQLVTPIFSSIAVSKKKPPYWKWFSNLFSKRNQTPDFDPIWQIDCASISSTSSTELEIQRQKDLVVERDTLRHNLKVGGLRPKLEE